MRIKRIVLKDHSYVAVLGRDMGDGRTIDDHFAARHFLQTGHHAQQRRFSAARRSDQHHELAIGNVQRHALDDINRPEGFPQIAQRHRTHRPVLHLGTSVGRPGSAPKGVAQKVRKSEQINVGFCIFHVTLLEIGKKPGQNRPPTLGRWLCRCLSLLVAWLLP